MADGYKGDGMPNLNVKSIERVYYSTSSCWARPAFEARGHDGLVLFTEGEIEYDFGYTKITATAGDILMFPGNLPYSGVKRCEGNVSFYVIDFDCFSVDELASLTIRKFSISYLKQCKEGDCLRFYKKTTEEATLIEGVNELDEIVVQAEFVFA